MITNLIKNVAPVDWATTFSPFQSDLATFLARQGEGTLLEAIHLGCIEGKPDLASIVLKKVPSMELVVQNDTYHHVIIIRARMKDNVEGALLEVAKGTTIEDAFRLLLRQNWKGALRALRQAK